MCHTWLFLYNNMRDFENLKKIIYQKLPIKDRIEISLIN